MSPTSMLLLTPTVKVGGSDLPATWRDALVELRVDLEYRLPGRAVLRFSDPGYGLTASSTVGLGASVEVLVRDKGTLIKGEVTGISVDQQEGDHPQLVVVVHDLAYRMSRANNVTTYVDHSYAAIVQAVASRHGLTASVSDADGQLDYLLQVDSDLHLLDALADRTGCDWWVDDHTLHFAKPSQPRVIDLKLGEELRTFSVRASGLRPDKVTVHGWDRHQQAAITGVATSVSSGAEPNVDLLSAFQHPGSKLGGTAELVTGALVPVTQSEAQGLSQALLDRAAVAAVVARGSADGTPTLRPGCDVKVGSAGPTSGTYHVTKVEHVYRKAGFESRFVAGDRRPTGLVDTLGSGRDSSGSFSHLGLVVGTVTNINDPDSMGRVKVRYPALSQQLESQWARIVGLGGGAERGMVFLPEVGDEVLVGFEAGDPRQPVVLGGLFGQKSTIPSPGVQEGKVPARRITSRLGHVVELADGTQPADQYILLALAGKEQKFNFAKDKVEMAIPAGVPLTIKVGNSSLAFDAQGSLTIKAVNIDIEAQGNLTMKSNGPASLKSSAQLTLEGTAQAGLKGATVAVEGQALTTVKGGMVQIN